MKNYQTKLNKLDKELNYLPLHRQVTTINQIIASLERKKFYQNLQMNLAFYLIA